MLSVNEPPVSVRSVDAAAFYQLKSTEPCVALAQSCGLFQMAFSSGTSRQAVVAYLRGEQSAQGPGAPPPQSLAVFCPKRP